MQPASTTLLVFTLGPDRELRRRLLPSRLAHVERALHQQGLTAALAAGRQCGCRLAVSSPDPLDTDSAVERVAQRGPTFGERFRGSLAVLHRRRPAEAVVVVGTDVPGLSTDRVGEALRHLAGDPDGVVVGPSPDGGFYLLASRQPLDEVLSRVRWQQRDTLKTLLAALRGAGRTVHFLPPMADLDRPSDLHRWLRSKTRPAGLWALLLAGLRELLAALLRPAAPHSLGQARPALAVRGTGRAPPA
jgi:glycosyltransferase A (GT-A) superfamily protein (DUF2064 family)